MKVALVTTTVGARYIDEKIHLSTDGEFVLIDHYKDAHSVKITTSQEACRELNTDHTKFLQDARLRALANYNSTKSVYGSGDPDTKCAYEQLKKVETAIQEA